MTIKELYDILLLELEKGNDDKEVEVDIHGVLFTVHSVSEGGILSTSV